MGSQPGKRVHVIASGIALALFVAQILFFVLFRSVNLDEGWYLWASKLVYEGKFLYRDFAFTQTPVLPYVYGLFQLVLGEGLYQGRIITAGFAILTFLMSGLVANRIAGIRAQLICWALLFTSVYSTAFHTYSATYALTAFLIVLAIYLALDAHTVRYRHIIAVFCMVLAAGARLSVIVAWIPFVVYLIANNLNRRRAIVEVSSTLLLSFFLVFGPFLISSGNNMLYDIFQFHTDRMSIQGRIGAMIHSTKKSLHDFAIPMFLSMGGVFAWAIGIFRADNRRQWIRDNLPELLIASVAALLFFAHLIPQTTSSYYNALIIPLLSILGGTILDRGFDVLARRRSTALQGIGYALLAVALVVNVVVQAQVLRRDDLMRLPLKNQIEVIRATAKYLNRAVPEGGDLLTFDTHLALEAGMDVLPGFEMSIFSYRPDWSTARSRQYRVINNELLLEAMRSEADAVAMTKYDLNFLYGERDLLFDTLHSHYRWAKTIPGFDPFAEEVRIYLPPQYDLSNTPDVPLEVHWDDGITLLGYDVDSEAHERGEPLWLTLYWQTESRPSDSYVIFTHLLAETGAVAVGWDNPPCRQTCPTDTWRAGEIIRDEYMLPLDESMPAGTYTIEVGIYHPNTGERLAVSSDTMRVVNDGLFLGQVEVR